MRVLEIHILGFEAFLDSGRIYLKDGMNIIVGQNNSGKTSILRALQPVLQDHRNRGPGRQKFSQIQSPRIDLVLEVEGAEIKDVIFEQGQQLTIPVQSQTNSDQFIENLFNSNHEFAVWHKPGQRFFAAYPGHGKFVDVPATQKLGVLISPQDGKLLEQVIGNATDSFPSLLHILWSDKLFYISTERQNSGSSTVDAVARLLPDTSNLAAVLLKLNGESGDVFEKLVAHLGEVFPSVGNVSLRILAGGPPRAEIRIWPTKAKEHIDLSFPLSESGTGVTQVLAILTAAATVARSVILIDEISSFLHPSATKSLLRILNSYYSDHQYIITTHSTEVINFSSPKSVHLVKRDGYETSITALDLTKLQNLRAVAEELGVSMADVFAADHVIWVEGPTEEICFPLLYESASSKSLPRGTMFVSIVATGDFSSRKRNRELIFHIYERLTAASSALAVSTKFHFDSEQLSEAEKIDAKRRSGLKISFLPRRNFECYLLNIDAISSFLIDRDDPRETPRTSDEIRSKVFDLANGKFRIAEWSDDIHHLTWLRKVDAANLIMDVCSEMTNQRVTFNKKEDALFLLKRCLTTAPGDLSELFDYVVELVEAG